MSTKNYREDKEIKAVGVGAFLLSMAYALAISRFANFLPGVGLLITYSSAEIAMMMIMEIAGGYLLYKIFSKKT